MLLTNPMRQSLGLASTPRVSLLAVIRMAKRNGEPVELQHMVAMQVPSSEEDAELQLAEPQVIQTNADLGAFPCKVKYESLVVCLFFSHMGFSN